MLCCSLAKHRLQSQPARSVRNNPFVKLDQKTYRNIPISGAVTLQQPTQLPLNHYRRENKTEKGIFFFFLSRVLISDVNLYMCTLIHYCKLINNPGDDGFFQGTLLFQLQSQTEC